MKLYDKCEIFCGSDEILVFPVPHGYTKQPKRRKLYMKSQLILAENLLGAIFFKSLEERKYIDFLLAA